MCACVFQFRLVPSQDEADAFQHVLQILASWQLEARICRDEFGAPSLMQSYQGNGHFALGMQLNEELITNYTKLRVCLNIKFDIILYMIQTHCLHRYDAYEMVEFTLNKQAWPKHSMPIISTNRIRSDTLYGPYITEVEAYFFPNETARHNACWDLIKHGKCAKHEQGVRSLIQFFA